MSRSLVLPGLLVVAVVLGGCAPGDERAGAPAPQVTDADDRGQTGGAADDTAAGPLATVPTSGRTASPLAELVVPLESAAYDPGEHTADTVAPTALRVDALGVSGAPVLPVGVDDAGELAVPGASDVGWYRYGPRPGEPGVTVLAAHVAFDGVDGVFRHLDRLRPGDTVSVALADGSTQAYRITGLTQHPKAQLPAELWVRDGPSRLALVTCGGDFDRTLRSYRDNVIAWAEPT